MPLQTSEESILVVPIFSDLGNLAFALRREVFIHEQSVPPSEEFDAKDLNATHLVTLRNGDLVATLRILWHPNLAQISRFVVRKSFRSAGVGSRLLLAAMDVVRQRDIVKIFLDSQSDKVSFYQRFHFKSYGDPYLDAGILHTRMKNYDDDLP